MNKDFPDRQYHKSIEMPEQASSSMVQNYNPRISVGVKRTGTPPVVGDMPAGRGKTGFAGRGAGGRGAG